ncbi:MAG: alpha/beta hydrolase domain-containing protein [Gammaproteobacteria bacterium]|jgi:hypothetical protein
MRRRFRPGSALRGTLMSIVLGACACAFGQAVVIPLDVGGGSIDILPDRPTAIALPDSAQLVEGPGPMFDSAPSQARGMTPDDFGYVAEEYFISGESHGSPYTTRLVVRRPADMSRFSGLVLAESMHASGAAHMFEYTAAYLMSEGHAAVEILTTSPETLARFNAARYGRLEVHDGQASELLASLGAWVRSADGPLGSRIRRMVLAGTSMSAGTLIDYLPAHMSYRTPDMQHIFDGFMPTSTGATIREIDVPLIQLPTMHEIEAGVPSRQDSDEPGRQYRLYEFAGIGHVDSRDNVRLIPSPCANPLSDFPLQAYMAVGLHHLFRWVDEGISPPRADRVWRDRNLGNDGSMMALDGHGNPRGGIRSPYLDVPVARYVPFNTVADVMPEYPSTWVSTNGMPGAETMCRLSAYKLPFSRDELRTLYRNVRGYRERFEARLDELEAEGWSLPVYRESILGDAAAVEF